MRTPSLRRRVTVLGAGLLAALLLLAHVVIYLGVRDRLNDTLEEVLRDRAQLVTEFAGDVPAGQLALRLAAAGVPAVIREPDGSVHTTEPQTIRGGEAPPAAGIPRRPRLARTVELPDGRHVQVFASRAGVDNTLRSLLVIQALATAGAILVAIALMRRAAALALAPLDTVVETAHVTASGQLDARLRPDRTDTELGRLAVAFDDMLDALEAAVTDARTSEQRSKDFLADAAHQLRTPLAGIQSSVEALLREPDAEQRDRLLGNVIRETRRTSRLVRSLLTVARLDRGEPTDRRPTDLVPLLRDEAERAEALAPHLDIRLDAPPSAVVDADAPALQEAIGNLLDNARRHARSGIVIAIDPGPATTRITVRDDGPGLATDRLEDAFRRFASFDGRGGSGLGLPIARGIARAHGGDVVYDDGGFVLTVSSTAAPATSGSTIVS